MKKLFILFALIIIAHTGSYAQTASTIQSSSTPRTEEYCELRVFSKSLIRKKTTARVDFGNGDETLKDETGKEAVFASGIDVLNYMNSRGWKLVDVHTRIWDGDSFTYYVMKRSLE
jgi:hypothetical protein